MHTLALNAHFDFAPPQAGSKAAIVCERFGVGRELVRRPVWSGQSVTVGAGRIILFTGRSGAGKSTALRLIEQSLPSAFRVERPDRQCLRPDVTLIDQFADPDAPNDAGTGFDHAAAVLSRAGLADARAWVLPPAALSDGQRFRAMLAKVYSKLGSRMAKRGMGVAILDEFCSGLDRATAETVCINLRRASSVFGFCAAIATTRDELAPHLEPEEWYEADAHSPAVRTLPLPEPNERTEPAVIDIPVRVADAFLQSRHYKGGSVRGTVCAFGLFVGEMLIGAITFAHPAGCLQAHLACGGAFRRTGRAIGSRIRDTLIISRLALDDAYRGRGLGRRLVERTLPRCGAGTVMVIAEMARHNPVFTAAGMKPAGCTGDGKPVLMWSGQV